MEDTVNKIEQRAESDITQTTSSRSPANRSESPQKAAGAKMPPPSTWIWFILIMLSNFWLARTLMRNPEEPVTVPYTLFKQEVSKDNVTAIYSRGENIAGRFRIPVTYPPDSEKTANARGIQMSAKSFTTTLPSFVEPGLESFLIDHGVEISAKPIEEEKGPLETFLYSFGPSLLFIGFYVWMFRRAATQGGGLGGGIFGIGKSKAQRYDREKTTGVSFGDVAGIDEAKNELVEIVDFLKVPSKYTRLGGTAPKGVLLIGAPGTGKTLLAKAVAGEAKVPFFSMSAAEFVEMIVGVGAARVRDLFKQAREQAPAIIFIDELDAIGRARGQVSIGGSSEQEQTLNQSLRRWTAFLDGKALSYWLRPTSRRCSTKRCCGRVDLTGVWSSTFQTRKDGKQY